MIYKILVRLANFISVLNGSQITIFDDIAGKFSDE